MSYPKIRVPSALVCRTYKQEGSIRKTVRALGISHQRVRKILITEGLYTTPLIKDIRRLRDKGYTVAEIGQKLGRKSSAIGNALPYKRHPDIECVPCKSTLAVRRYRAKQKLEQAAVEPQ